jgi:hypothetical protein
MFVIPIVVILAFAVIYGILLIVGRESEAQRARNRLYVDMVLDPREHKELAEVA